MQKTVWVLLGLLVVSNAVWAVVSLSPPENADPEAPGGLEAEEMNAADVVVLRARVRELEQELADVRRGPTLVGRESEPREESAQHPDAEQQQAREREDQERRARLVAERARAREVQAARVEAHKRVDVWKVDILQVEDSARREAGLAALEGAIRSRDSALAAAALHALQRLREIDYDRAGFGAAVRSRLDDADRDVRGAAAYALKHVDPTPEDGERLLDVAEAHPDEASLLSAAAQLSTRRIEGRLADLFVRALATDDPQRAKSTANVLRGMWVTEAVENAALDAFERTASIQDHGVWWHVLGQFRPTRERRVRFVFDVLKEETRSAPQLLDRALDRHSLDPAATSLAARLAAEALPSAPNAMVRRVYLRVLAQVGGREEARAVRAYAANPMVGESVRREALAVAERMESGR